MAKQESFIRNKRRVEEIYGIPEGTSSVHHIVTRDDVRNPKSPLFGTVLNAKENLYPFEIENEHDRVHRLLRERGKHG